MDKNRASALTGDVSLRDVREDDLPIFFAQQLDPDANHMAAFPARPRDAFTTHWTKILSSETITAQTIVFEGEVAGNIVSFEQFGELQVGYWLGKEFWGKGIATKALTAFLEQVKQRPLYAYVAKHNSASIRVLEKCGFTIIGENKEFSSAEGEEIDEFILQLSASEKEEKRG